MMDKWRFFDITHREHLLCNPMSAGKFEELLSLLRLQARDRVLEIATGKGEFIIRLVERYGISGIGVDLSPYCIADARKKLAQRLPDAPVRFLEMDGADYQPEKPASFHLAACIGASWIFGGHRETLAFLKQMVVPGGWVVAGEPYWRREPAQAYLEEIGASAETYKTHHGNVQAGEELGLRLEYTLVSSEDDWDRYEGLQWYAAEEWARENPEDPDVSEVLERVRENKEAYLRWGRDTVGWAIYMFRKRARES
jgi:SAM-dependent methyltransferase